jgi:hypothetical protein
VLRRSGVAGAKTKRSRRTLQTFASLLFESLRALALSPCLLRVGGCQCCRCVWIAADCASFCFTRTDPPHYRLLMSMCYGLQATPSHAAPHSAPSSAPLAASRSHDTAAPLGFGPSGVRGVGGSSAARSPPLGSGLSAVAWFATGAPYIDLAWAPDEVRILATASDGSLGVLRWDGSSLR